MIIIPTKDQPKGNRLWKMWRKKNEKSISGAIKVNEKAVMEHLDALIRKSVEDTLNTLLNEEADAICTTAISEVRIDRIPGQEHINGNF